MPQPRRPLRSDLAQGLAFAVLVALAGWGVVAGAQAMPYNWQWDRVPRYLFRVFNGQFYAGPLLKGLGVTLEISFWAFWVSLGAGLEGALLLRSASPVGRALARFYVEAVRNTPLLVQIYLFYFVLAPILGIGRQATGVLALGLFEGAFAVEIIRAGIVAVPLAQTEAALSLGLSRFQAMRLVVLPQALRIVLPPMTSVAVNLVKHSAIVSAIAIFDLANEARSIIADTFMTFEIWLTVAVLYLVVTTAMSGIAMLIERRLAVGRAA